MAYVPKSQRSRVDDPRRKKELDELSSNKVIDDIHGLAKQGDQFEKDIDELKKRPIGLTQQQVEGLI